jgi:hypothetical protein
MKTVGVSLLDKETDIETARKRVQTCQSVSTDYPYAIECRSKRSVMGCGGLAQSNEVIVCKECFDSNKDLCAIAVFYCTAHHPNSPCEPCIPPGVLLCRPSNQSRHCPIYMDDADTYSPAHPRISKSPADCPGTASPSHDLASSSPWEYNPADPLYTATP